MSYTKNEVRFPSSDGKHSVSAEIYIPEDIEPRGILQISHGMIDYIGRYGNLIEALTASGYVVAGHDHLGHGRTAESPEELGYFAERDGWELVVGDIYGMNTYLHAEFPRLPIVLFGHSMGSFMGRLYVAKYPDTVAGFIIHGTGGRNPLLGAGKMLARIIRAAKGGSYRSSLITNLAFGSYNKHYDPSEGHNAWLTRDGAQVSGRDEDPFTSYMFTVSGFIDLFEALGRSNSDEWFDSYPKDLPTLIMSGEDDPVGDYGKGVRFVYENLEKRSARVELKLYEGARHELFNETNRDEVFCDIVYWLDGVTWLKADIEKRKMELEARMREMFDEKMESVREMHEENRKALEEIRAQLDESRENIIAKYTAVCGGSPDESSLEKLNALLARFDRCPTLDEAKRLMNEIDKLFEEAEQKGKE